MVWNMIYQRRYIMLYELLYECINIPYSQAGISASYATRVSKATLYIFFEGSNGKNDWKINISFPAKPYQRMGKTVWFAHGGFLDTWKEIEPFVALRLADPKIEEVIITGYSHGAALAMLCHEYVWYNRTDLRDKLHGYGFGAPRVFWGIKTRDLRERWKNFTVIRNIDDIVTHLPPAALGYSHVGQILQIGSQGKYSAVDAHRAENMLTELKAYENAKVRKNFVSVALF